MGIWNDLKERFVKTFHNEVTAPQVLSLPEYIEAAGLTSSAGVTVTSEGSKNVHTAYRCINVLSDDFAKMPLQTFVSRGPGQIERLKPTYQPQNIAWLTEISPNRWMTPFIFKKTLMMWLLTHGNAYAWSPLDLPRREMFVLNSAATVPIFDRGGNLWYQSTFADGQTLFLPDVEILHLRINAIDGINGRSVITYAREVLGRQLGAYETQGKFYAQGLNPSGILWSTSELSKEARGKVRAVFEEQMSGSSNAYRLGIIDSKFSKFEPITMKPIDVQFLESIQQNDLEVANFFGMPLFKLNMGKQSYNSNEQADLDYLKTTLDPYLVQTEQEAGRRWLTEAEQLYTYFRFNRDVLLRTDAKTRAEVLEKRILSGTLTPNQACAIEDMPAYPGGDQHYIPSNMSVITSDGLKPVAESSKKTETAK